MPQRAGLDRDGWPRDMNTEAAALIVAQAKFSEEQPRDEQGRFSGEGGGEGGASEAAAEAEFAAREKEKQDFAEVQRGTSEQSAAGRKSVAQLSSLQDAIRRGDRAKEQSTLRSMARAVSEARGRQEELERRLQGFAEGSRYRERATGEVEGGRDTVRSMEDRLRIGRMNAEQRITPKRAQGSA